MKLTMQVFHNGRIIHSQEIGLYPVLAKDQVHKIDITSTIEELLFDQRQSLLPDEAHEAGFDKNHKPE